MPLEMALLERGDADVEAVDAAGRTVTVRLCRWGEVRDVVERDGTAYRESHAAGSLTLADNVHVVDRHTGALIGRAEPDTFRDDGDGPVVDMRIAHTAAGSDALALIDAGVIRAVSMEFDPRGAFRDRAGVLVRTRSIVHGIALAFRPQHDAPILAVRDQPTGDTMPTFDTPIVPDVVDPAPATVTHVNWVDQTTLDRALEDVRRDLVAHVDTPTGHPAARYRSIDDYATQRWSDGSLDADLLHRALTDQISSNNPGVIPPAWIQTVYGIVDFGRPTINAFGVRDTPAEGLELTWPYFDGDLTALVGKQATEKTAITSVRVDLKKGTEALETYAGGSDISYQLIRRSSPSYRDAYLRIMFAAYAAVTDLNAAAQALAAAGQEVVWDPATDTAAELRTALFEASVMVQNATGAPASFALVASDVFTAIGGLDGLWPGMYGTSNTAGTADAGSLNVNVSGLQIIHEPHLAAGAGIVSNRQAGGWHEDGPFTVAAEDVEKLGQNVAVWGLGAFAAALPAGIVSIVPVATP